jgi:hypothetical protein
VKWLDEGLAHIAEELLFSRESGIVPRSNIGTAQVRASGTVANAYNTDMSANDGRYRTYLQSPSTNSPYNANDSLPTRGAAWSFLRYLVDQKTLGFPSTASAALRRTGSGSVIAPGGATTMDYAAVVVNSAIAPLPKVSYTIRVDNAPTSVAARPEGAVALEGSVMFGSANSSALIVDRAFESRLRDRERRLMPAHAARARSWYGTARPRATTRRASFDLVPGTSADGDSWYRLSNSVDTGVVNVRKAFGVDVSTVVRDWSVSNQVDDVASFISTEYRQPSWNWRNLYTTLSPSSTSYPLFVRTLPPTLLASGAVIGGGAGYFRFSVPISSSATVTLTDASGTSSSTLQLVLVRTR